MKADSRGAVNCSPFPGESRGNPLGESGQFPDELTEVQGLNSGSNRGGRNFGIGFLMYENQPLCSVAHRALQ